jgi:hypothetical protein
LAEISKDKHQAQVLKKFGSFRDVFKDADTTCVLKTESTKHQKDSTQSSMILKLKASSDKHQILGRRSIGEKLNRARPTPVSCEVKKPMLTTCAPKLPLQKLPLNFCDVREELLSLRE